MVKKPDDHVTMQVTWDQFDFAVLELVEAIDRSADWIYGVPRGGLCLAVALSHASGIPLIMEPQPGMILVDDIADSGKTLLTLLEHYPEPRQVLTWFRRQDCPVAVNYYCNEAPLKRWIVFPWEQPL